MNKVIIIIIILTRHHNKLAATESLLVTGGDWNQTLCVACRMKLTTNES